MKFITLLLFWLVMSVSSAFATDVVLPLTLDHKLLTSLLLRNGFPGEEKSAAIVGSPEDCTYVRVAEPQFSASGKLLRLEMRLDIRVGSQLGENCFSPIEWNGYLELLQQPIFDGRTFTLSFRTVDSNLLTLSRQPATVAGFLWNFAKPRVYAHLDKIQFDLAPPVKELHSFVAPLFHEGTKRATQAMLDSMRGGDVHVEESAVVVELLAEVEEVFELEDDQSELTTEDRQHMIQLWETWDAFLVRLLITMANQPLLPEDRETLIEVLLDTRYVFIAALEQQNLEKDFVRLQFVRAWQQLAPVFRRQLYAQPSENSLGYLAFFTAADALAVFDRMGPTLGIEISQQGLLRLAAMLAGKSTVLPYAPQVDKQLRELLQLPPIEEDVKPPESYDDIEIPEEEMKDEPLSLMLDYFIRPVHAAELPKFEEILRWKVPKTNVDEYLTRVRNVLSESLRLLLSRGETPQQFHGMFKKLIPAMAWQESCFRQFVVRDKKLTYLLSYNQSSVGLMQINERVWRGVYDLNRLRWDIHYNALAGCEIADLYLRKYALKHSDWGKNANMELLSRSIYSMYNGGPGQYKKFLDRERSGKHYRSDLLFLEKLKWVGDEKWENINKCF
ncbi:MAG: lytic transglycosylase domain-containing protein [Desulforhopalus sp.]